MPAGISRTNGVVTITGSQKNDFAKVEIEQHDVTTPFDDRLKVSIPNPNGSTTVWYDLYKPGTLPITSSCAIQICPSWMKCGKSLGNAKLVNSSVA